MAPILTLTVLSILSWLSYLSIQPDIFSASSDSAIYALSARQLLAGHGYTLTATLPQYHSMPPLSHTPILQSLAIVPSFAIFGVRDFTAILPNGLFYCLSIQALYLLARKTGYSQKNSFFISLILMASPLMLQSSVSAMAEPLFILLLILICLSQGFVMGLLIGLASVTKFTGVFFLPASLIAFPATRRLPLLLGFCLTFSLTILFPPVQQKLDFNHNQLWSYLAYQSLFPGSDGGRYLSPYTISDILPAINKISTKALLNTRAMSVNFLIFPFVLFLLRPHRHPLYLFTVLAGLQFFLFHILTVANTRYFLPFLPLAAIFAAKNVRPFLLVGIILLTLFTQPGLPTLLIKASSPAHNLPTPIYTLSQHISSLTPPGALISSNLFASLSWYSHRPTSFFPRTIPDLNVLKPDYLFLVSQPPFTSLEPSWLDLVDHPRDLGQLRLLKTFHLDPGSNYYQVPVSAALYSFSAQSK